MTVFSTVFFLIAAASLLALPRRLAPIPLLATACYMTLGQGVALGPFSFPVIRLVMLVGIARVFARGERPAGPFNGLDKLMCAWSAWAIFASFFHADPSAALVNRLGMVYNTVTFYFLIRCLCQNLDDAVSIIRYTAIILVPVALCMLAEQFTKKNIFASLGGIPLEVSVRNDRTRAQGPFAHAILAGTVGAVCLPWMIAIWRQYPSRAMVGLASSAIIVLASASSGPIMSLLFGLFALVLWRWRHLTHRLRVAAIVGYIALDLVMNAPAYFLIARIDIVGGSTGYHRVKLIEAAVNDISSWWFAGTDYTRHWTPYGVPWSEDHADITNHYIAQGVHGGLPLMIMFMGFLAFGFYYVGRIIRSHAESDTQSSFRVWTLGASLFVHSATAISVAYFDQSYFFLCMCLGILGSLYSVSLVTFPESDVASFDDSYPTSNPLADDPIHDGKITELTPSMPRF